VLVINVCFCLHEFRRMGKPGIPDFDDLQRTVIVDLRNIAKWDEFKAILHPLLEVMAVLSDRKRQDDHSRFSDKLKSFQTRLKVSFDPKKQTPRVAEFESMGKKLDSLPIWSLLKFLSHVDSKIP
jgi:hypothetical protein